MSFFQSITIIFFVSNFAFAQLGSTLQGTVQDSSTGEYLWGAELFLAEIDKEAVSDEMGRFLFGYLKPGTYEIDVSLVGYQIHSQKVEIDSFQNILHIQLQPQLSSTPEIVISGTKDSGLQLMLPARVDRLQPEQMQQSTQSTLDHLLGEHSGAFIKSYGPAGQLQTVSIRGMAAEQTQVLLDGIPLNGMQLGSVDLGQFHTANLSEALVYYGGSALLSGSGSIGGAINLRSIQPSNRLGYTARISLASFQNSDLSFAVNLPVGSFRQRLHLARQSGKNDYATTYKNEAITLENRDYHRLNLIYQTEYDLNSKWTVSSYLSWLGSEAGAATAFINPLAEQGNKARTENENVLAKMELRYQGVSGELTARSWLRDETMHYDNPSLIINNQALHSRHRNREWATQINGRYLFRKNLLFLAGGDFSIQQINSTNAGIHDRRHSAFYLMQDWQVFQLTRLHQKLHLQLNSRWEHDSVYGIVFLPGAGLRYALTNIEIFTAIGKNYRSPSFNDLYWVPGGNPDLKSESALNSELGAQYRKSIYGALMDIAATVYRNRVENQIKWLPQNNVWRPQNILEVLSRGFELDGSLSDRKEIHKIGFSYNRQRVKKAAPEFNGDPTEGNLLPFIPGEQWRVHAQSGFGEFRAGVAVNAMSFRYKSIQNEADQVLAGHSIWRLWAGYHLKIWKHYLGLTASVENLFDADYQVMPGYPMPPRNYRGTVLIKF